MTPPLHCPDIATLRAALSPMRRSGTSIGFVPTMGALHEGHASLIRRSAAANTATVASIFVNPLQFGPNEDFAKYPRTFEADMALCTAAGATHVFTTSPAEMYPTGFATSLRVGGLGDRLCGLSRPGHFDGVTTVVAKLFAIVGPDVAYFGRKDFQQATIIRRMVADLNLPLRVEVCPTVREHDGLALSSRNRYLSADERRQALSISRGLRAAVAAFAGGERDARALEERVASEIAAQSLARLVYVEAVEPTGLARVKTADESTVIAVAAFVGSTRLIDNMPLVGEP